MIEKGREKVRGRKRKEEGEVKQKMHIKTWTQLNKLLHLIWLSSEKMIVGLPTELNI